MDFDWLGLIEALGGGLSAAVIVGLVALLVASLLTIRAMYRQNQQIRTDLTDKIFAEKDAKAEMASSHATQLFQTSETMRLAMQAMQIQGGAR